ncbi:saccharopine dehydrogenase C-terminal domain-containing protein [uncultured Tateyamaria sp.]|uniref:saccharopine dehydrogenase family protein n=1 Tax=uncultured Tateyamaria sp. TaxID=455651 RepID=UPI00262A8AFC|nr:saccharopine dehydrogenase C-terminal domain-containing protein [uncultured Tateyamaria sp.]
MENIAVLGLGKIGRLAAELLHNSGFTVTGIDKEAPKGDLSFAFKTLDLSSATDVVEEFGKQDAVLSCLPFQLNIALAQAAHDAGVHYFDLTEDVPTTNAIIEMSKTAKSLMAPQCGLAPGFIGIVGANLISQFDDCRACKMRVGALPQHPTGLMGYAFNWSPEGVVNEYLNDCEVLENGERKWVSPMEWVEDVYIDGMKLEAFTTSGGLGTMCETYQGSVANIDYKTMRYPGHVQQMNFFFHELLMRDRREEAGEILINAKPPVQDDVVYVHASAEGHINGRLERREFVRGFRPIEVAGQQRTAIAWTTAGSVVAIIEMVRDGKLPNSGFLKQEDISLDDFLAMPTGSFYAG